MEFKIGADPEFFLRDKSTGKFVSAHGIIPGTKRNPLKVDCGAVQVDGMALEFNIDPATSAEQFERNINTVLVQLRGMVDDQLEFVFEPTADFGKEYIDSQPEAAKELGCEPDYNAYTGQINPKPNADMGFRTASGHIHIGWTDQQDITDKEHIDACHMLVKQLDTFLLVPSFGWDRDELRQSMYGAPGAYRPKHYGVEYRVLSNAWLRDSKSIHYVFNQTMRGVETLMSGTRNYDNYPTMQEWLQTEAGMERIYNAIRYTNGHQYTSDANWIFELFKKAIREGYERPTIKARVEKLSSGYVIHKATKALHTWEEALANPNNFTHPNEYTRYCFKNALAKPSSPADAARIYEEHQASKFIKMEGAYKDAAKKKIGKKVSLDWTVAGEIFSTPPTPSAQMIISDDFN